MQLLGIAGSLLSVIGLAGYAAGIAVPYPGRAFSLTLLMAGLTLFLVGRSEAREAEV